LPHGHRAGAESDGSAIPRAACARVCGGQIVGLEIGVRGCILRPEALVSKESAMKLALTFLLSCASVAHASSRSTPAARLDVAATVLEEIMQAPDKSIPQDLLDHAHAVVIVPGLKKGAFIVGGKYGKGFILCRNKSGTGWAAPGAVRIEGAS